MLAVILLATYNGERYLGQQLDSIFAQTHDDFLLIVKDDCSTDMTAIILRRYRERYPDKFTLLAGHGQNRGPSRMFSDLLEYVIGHEQALELADYCIAFCDQDDIWHEDKLRVSIDALQTLCAQDAGNDPMLRIHSELRVVDGQGQLIHSSLSAYQGLRPRRNHFIELVMHNTVTGCSALITPALARACTPVPAEAYMHDWWCALIASLCGRIHYIAQPLLDYRQHDANTLGARRFEQLPKHKILRGMIAPEANRNLKRVARQARYLLQHPPCRLSRLQKLAARLVGYGMAAKSIVLRAVTMKLLQYLSIHVLQRNWTD
jgi:glycosyltransferase involved in cell wall biosynthesis